MSKSKPHVVVLGSGFAAFSFAKQADLSLFDLTLVSPRNHFLFTPLLPSTTVGTVEFRSIIEPIRIARPAMKFFQATCKSINLKKKTIRCEGSPGTKFVLPYDMLVIAVGSTVNTYGIPGVREHALFLKDLSDARKIRQRIIDCFEQAAHPNMSEEKQQQLLHFVVVGGGPTGVEFAAEMHDFLKDDLTETYTGLSEKMRITLLEATAHILNTFDAALSDYTARLFRRQNIHLRTASPVRKIDARRIHLKDGSTIPYGLVVWTAGAGPSDLVDTLPLEKDKSSRILTDDFFRVAGYEDVYAMGDCATPGEKNFPATAQVAQQEGKYLAAALAKNIKGREVRSFHYRH